MIFFFKKKDETYFPPPGAASQVYWEVSRSEDQVPHLSLSLSIVSQQGYGVILFFFKKKLMDN